MRLLNPGQSRSAVQESQVGMRRARLESIGETLAVWLVNGFFLVIGILLIVAFVSLAHNVLDFIEIVGSIVALLLVAFVFPVLLYFSYWQIRDRGYRAPGALVLVAACWTASYAVAWKFAPSSISGTTRGTLFVSYYFLAPALAGALCVVLLLRVVPRRSGRVFGDRKVRIPFTLIGLIWIGLLLALVIGLIAKGSGEGLTKLLLGAAPLLSVGLFLIRLGLRHQSPQSLDNTEPIGALYLRPFRQEGKFFVIGPKSEYGDLATSLHADAAEQGQNVGLRFEEYFGDAIGARIGRFVALGNPEDYVVPEGSQRLYATDAEWKQRVDDLARRASCIVMDVGSSRNLRWELQHLRREGMHEKLFIVTPPDREGADLSWWFWGLLWRIRGLRPVGWRQFADYLTQLGYGLDPDCDPGPGAVVTFDADGTGVVLAADARQPQDYIEPIRLRMQLPLREEVAGLEVAEDAPIAREPLAEAELGSGRGLDEIAVDEEARAPVLEPAGAQPAVGHPVAEQDVVAGERLAQPESSEEDVASKRPVGEAERSGSTRAHWGIPGFRSGRWWKRVVASLFYGGCLLLVLLSLVGGQWALAGEYLSILAIGVLIVFFASYWRIRGVNVAILVALSLAFATCYASSQRI